MILISNLFQKEGVGGHGGAGGAAVFLFDYAAEAVESELPLPHFEERADDGADHIAQKTVGFDMENEQVVLFKPVSLHYLTVICLDLGMKL